MSQDVKFPEIQVRLVGTDGNAMMIVGKVVRAMRNYGLSMDEINTFREEALSGDYDNVLQTAMRWVDVS